MREQRRTPWREVLFVNGCMSLILGIGAYVAVRLYAADVDAWIRGHATDKVQAAAEVLVLGYLAYAVSLIAAVMLSVLLPHWLGRKPWGMTTGAAVPPIDLPGKGGAADG
jgi:hypothetical protein